MYVAILCTRHAINIYHVSVCHRLLSSVVRARPVIVYLVPTPATRSIFIATYKTRVTSHATPLYAAWALMNTAKVSKHVCLTHSEGCSRCCNPVLYRLVDSIYPYIYSLNAHLFNGGVAGN